MLVNLNLENKRVLIVGGGKVAFRKLKKLQKYNCTITLVSPEFLEEVNNLNIQVIKDEFKYDYLKNVDIVFLCTNNPILHEEIIEYSKDKKLIINNSTSQTNMDFSMVASFDYDEYEIAVTSKQGIANNRKFRDELKRILEEEL